MGFHSHSHTTKQSTERELEHICMPYTCDSYRHFNVKYFILTAPNINTFMPRERERKKSIWTKIHRPKNTFIKLWNFACEDRICCHLSCVGILIHMKRIFRMRMFHIRRMTDCDRVECMETLKNHSIRAVFYRIKSIALKNNNWMYSILLQKFSGIIWNFHGISSIKEEARKKRKMYLCSIWFGSARLKCHYLHWTEIHVLNSESWTYYVKV